MGLVVHDGYSTVELLSIGHDNDDVDSTANLFAIRIPSVPGHHVPSGSELTSRFQDPFESAGPVVDFDANGARGSEREGDIRRGVSTKCRETGPSSVDRYGAEAPGFR